MSNRVAIFQKTTRHDTNLAPFFQTRHDTTRECTNTKRHGNDRIDSAKTRHDTKRYFDTKQTRHFSPGVKRFKRRKINLPFFFRKANKMKRIRSLPLNTYNSGRFYTVQRDFEQFVSLFNTTCLVLRNTTRTRHENVLIWPTRHDTTRNFMDTNPSDTAVFVFSCRVTNVSCTRLLTSEHVHKEARRRM